MKRRSLCLALVFALPAIACASKHDNPPILTECGGQGQTCGGGAGGGSSASSGGSSPAAGEGDDGGLSDVYGAPYDEAGYAFDSGLSLGD